MKRRKFLEAGTTILFVISLSEKLTKNTAIMTTSNQKFEVSKTEDQWRKELTPEQFKVLRKHGTERAGTSPLDKTYAPGTYECAGCGQPLFTSETKFNSGTGWPSFYAPIEGAIEKSVDRKSVV